MPNRKPDAPVVALDLDGTLGDYHFNFTRFAEQWTGKEMPDPTAISAGTPFHKWLGLSKETYRECKLAYRQGGAKRWMPCYEGARELTVHMRKRGAQVWICTTRPYLRLDTIDPDTRHWLKRNGIQFDGVLYGEHKYRDLVKITGPERVLFVVDDLPQMLIQAHLLGLGCVLRSQPYNGLWKPNFEFAVAEDMQQIRELFDKEMEKHRV